MSIIVNEYVLFVCDIKESRHCDLFSCHDKSSVGAVSSPESGTDVSFCKPLTADVAFRSRSLVGLTSRMSDMHVEECNDAPMGSNSAGGILPSLPFHVDAAELLLGPHSHLPGDQILVNLVVDAVVQAQEADSGPMASASGCSSVASSAEDFSPPLLAPPLPAQLQHQSTHQPYPELPQLCQSQQQLEQRQELQAPALSPAPMF